MTNKYAPKLTDIRGQIIKIGNLDLYFEEYGSGKPLLLLHGFGGCAQNWQPFIGELSQSFRLIVVDLRGHGYSNNPEKKFTHKLAAEDIFLLLDKLGIENFSAIGMSTGGMVLLHMATSQPNRLESLVLVSATTHFPEQARNIMRRVSLETMPQDVREMYQECAKRGEEQIQELISQFNDFYHNHDDMNFSSEDLSIIKARTLIIHGERDNFFPVEIALDMNRSIPNSSLWIIPNGEHVPIFNSEVLFTSEALKFLVN